MREKNKHWFEIKAWAEGWKILTYADDLKDWIFSGERPMWYYHSLYVVNDALVEFRKAEKEGKQIERNFNGMWFGTKMSGAEPTNNIESVKKFRIKPKYKVGDKVITEDYASKILDKMHNAIRAVF